jgi:hypothetical protein
LQRFECIVVPLEKPLFFPENSKIVGNNHKRFQLIREISIKVAIVLSLQKCFLQSILLIDKKCIVHKFSRYQFVSVIQAILQQIFAIINH